MHKFTLQVTFFSFVSHSKYGITWSHSYLLNKQNNTTRSEQMCCCSVNEK